MKKVKTKPTRRENRAVRTQRKQPNMSIASEELIKRTPSGKLLAEIFTHHPTGDFAPYFDDNIFMDWPAHFYGMRLNRTVAIDLALDRMAFKNKGDSLSALNAFIEADEVDWYPPMWALRWLITGFRKFKDSKGKVPLEKILGLAPKPKQRITDTEKRLVLHRNTLLVHDINILYAIIGKKDAAIHAVWLKNNIIKKEGSLRNIYFASEKESPTLEMAKDIVNHWTEQQKQEFKDSYR